MVTGCTSAPEYTIPTSCVFEVTCTLCAAVPPLTESFTAPVVSLLESVTAFANVPEIAAPVEFAALNVKMPLPNDMGVPACPLGSPLRVSVFGTYCDPVFGVGDAVGLGDAGQLGNAVALGVAVGATVGELDGDGIGLADDDVVGIADADDVGDALDPPLGGALGDAPADAVDVG